MSLTLLDWRRSVAALYAAARADAERDPDGALARFRGGRDRLFREHPDSPLPADRRAAFAGVRYWPRDPTLRFEAAVEEAEPLRVGSASVTGESFALSRIGTVRLPVGDLEVYWIDVYGGGVFVPFRDGTSGRETYGAGRYLEPEELPGGRLRVDFNMAYNPYCAYNDAWSCPLPPAENRLSVRIEAGEKKYHD